MSIKLIVDDDFEYIEFEIDVILDEYQTYRHCILNIVLFEIDVILDEYQTV